MLFRLRNGCCGFDGGEADQTAEKGANNNQKRQRTE